MLAGQDAKMKILGTSLDESNISVVDNWPCRPFLCYRCSHDATPILDVIWQVFFSGRLGRTGKEWVCTEVAGVVK
jgi:hypothetical protein